MFSQALPQTKSTIMPSIWSLPIQLKEDPTVPAHITTSDKIECGSTTLHQISGALKQHFTYLIISGDGREPRHDQGQGTLYMLVGWVLNAGSRDGCSPWY